MSGSHSSVQAPEVGSEVVVFESMGSLEDRGHVLARRRVNVLAAYSDPLSDPCVT